MRIPSGTVDQYIYFVAVDSVDLKSRETGLTGFTVYRSRDGAAAAAMTTPTINETDATNMPGVYELLLDEDMTIGSGNDSEEMVFHIEATGMAPVTRVIELYRREVTGGETLTVASGAGTAKLGNTSHGGAAATLTLENVTVTATSGDAVALTGQGSGDGITTTGGASGGHGIYAAGGGNSGHGLRLQGATTAPGGTGLYTAGGGTAGDGIVATGDVDINADIDATAIGGSTVAASNIASVYTGVKTGSVSGTPAANQFDTNLAEATNTFVDSAILFTSGNLLYESQRISAYSVTNGQITVAKNFTQAPAASDTFVIIGNLGSS